MDSKSSSQAPGQKRTHDAVSEQGGEPLSQGSGSLRFGDSFDVGPSVSEDEMPQPSDKSREGERQDESSDRRRKDAVEQVEDIDEPFDPKKEVSSFNWRDLESRYQKAMREHDEKQAAIHEELKRVMNVRPIAFTSLHVKQ